MKKKTAIVLTIFILSFFIVSPMLQNSSAAEAKKHILVLNSYTLSLTFTSEQVRGIREVLPGNHSNYELYFEFMDTKRFSGAQYFADYYNFLSTKYNNTKFDLVIVTDNDAFNFFLAHRNDSIFTGVPMVFSGINYFVDSWIQGHYNVTGVVENTYIKDNVDIIIKLQPDVQNIYVIYDQTTTGVILRNELKSYEAQYPGITFHNITNIPTEQMLNQVAAIPKGAAIFYLLWNRDSQNEVFTHEGASALIGARANVPVYGLWDILMDHGIIGGKLTSAYLFGKEAALQAEKILEGTPIANVPIVRETPFVIQFDYREMQKFNIPESNLPSNATVLNKPIVDLTVLYLILIIIGISGLFTAIITYLMRANKKQKELQKQLKAKQEDIINIVNQAREVTAQLASAAEELSSSAEEVSSSSENIASSQQQISKGASNQVTAIMDLQKRFKEFSDGVKEIRNKADSITQIADLIRNIANQTNMLALNAAIEAARAGESGRGFNVVADQVRKLADESRKAVEQTDVMINNIRQITEKQESNAIDMVKSIDSVSVVAEETSASTEESAAAAEEQASSMELITSTAQSLLELAEKLSASYKEIFAENEQEKNKNEKTLEESAPKIEEKIKNDQQKKDLKTKIATSREVPAELEAKVKQHA